MNTELVVAYFIWGRSVYKLEAWSRPANLLVTIEAIKARALSIPAVVELRKNYTFAEVEDAEQHTGTYRFTNQELEFAQLWVDAGWHETVLFHVFLENMLGRQEDKYYRGDYWE